MAQLAGLGGGAPTPEQMEAMLEEKVGELGVDDACCVCGGGGKSKGTV